MEEKKKLNIIAITDYSPYGDAAVRHAGVLAAIFKTTLTIITDFSIYPKKFKEIDAFKEERIRKDDIWKEEIGKIQSAIEEPLQEISPNFNRTLDNLSVHDIETIMQNDHFTAKMLYDYAEDTNTIMFVIGVSKKGKNNYFSRKRAAKFIKPSRIPVMTVGNKMPEASVYQHVILPLDIDRQAKEKVLWAGYFSKFYYATVHVIHTIYKDSFLRQKIKGNIDFTEKLYKNLEVDYQLHEISPTVDNIDHYSLSFARKINASLTVIMMTKYYSVFDFLFGPKEFAVIGNDEGFPVLCINEREDLYVLCV
ncbi:hypothetical protein LJC68_06990 [Bacteroidales bacterium OttesenSCG-928-B11]|nr:hypothetical protein [Bacteroidales bacterium OttesenSCG-928-E04]MDL2312605.1 hypothetical protein [Bacteroidales bacterium OttesenSCG-928-B11]